MKQSAACHFHSTAPRSLHSSINTAQLGSNTPRSTQPWKRLWIVLSSPSSLGRRFQWKPVRILNMVLSRIRRGVSALAPRGLGRVQILDYRVKLFPQVIRSLPYRWQGLALSLSPYTALRTRRYDSTWYIPGTIHRFENAPMDGGRRSNFQPPIVSRSIRPPGPI